MPGCSRRDSRCGPPALQICATGLRAATKWLAFVAAPGQRAHNSVGFRSGMTAVPFENEDEVLRSSGISIVSTSNVGFAELTVVCLWREVAG